MKNPKSPPNYITSHQAVGKTRDFAWGRTVWHPITYGETPSGEPHEPELQEKFIACSGSACMALAAACAEWTVWRLKDRVRPEDFEDALLVIEAAWVASFEPKAVAFPKDESRFPDYPVSKTKDESAQGALVMAVMMVNRAFQNLGEEEWLVAMAAKGGAVLAVHVADKGTGFKKWLELQLAYLKKRNPKKKKGPPIFPSILDDHNKDPKTAKKDFISSLSTKNKYIKKKPK